MRDRGWAGSAPASMNRRAAAVRGVLRASGVGRGEGRQSCAGAPAGPGAATEGRGALGHLGPGRGRQGGRLVRQQRRLPESLEPTDVSAFLADLVTHRDRSIVLLMVLRRATRRRGPRTAAGRRRQGRRQVRVMGKGGRERTVPVDRAFFAELAAYLRLERPPGSATPECFVVLSGSTAGQAMTEAGMRSVFRNHRRTSGATRVRPHRLRHTYGTELAAAGIDLLALRELMGHASPGDHRRLRAPVDRAPRSRVRSRPGGDRAMTAAVARQGTGADHVMVDGYARFCQEAGVGDRGIRDRLRHARSFLAVHPDLDVWMARPVTARLADLDRDPVWLLIVWAVFRRAVAIDMDLLAAKHLFGLRQTAETLWPEDLAVARGVGTRLGWSPKWTRDVVDETGCAVMAFSGHRLRELTDDDLERFLDALGGEPLGVGRHPQVVASADVRGAPGPLRAGRHRHAAPAAHAQGECGRTLQWRHRGGDPTGDDRLRQRPLGGAVALIGRGSRQRPGPLRGVPRRPSPPGGLAASARTGPHRGVPDLEPHPLLAGSSRPRPAGIGQRRARRGARPAQPARRHHPVGMGGAARTASDVRRRRPPPASPAPTRPSPRCRRRPVPPSRPPRRRLRQSRPHAATPRRAASRGTARPRARLRRGLRTDRNMAAGPARQARHRTIGSPRRRHRRHPRHLGGAAGQPTPSPRSPHRPALRLPLRRARPAAEGMADPQRPRRRRRRRWARPARRDAAAGHASPAPTHLRHRTRQRRHEPARPHGPPRPRHPRDDASLRRARLAHPAGRLRRSDGQGPQAHPRRPRRATGGAGQSRVDRLGVPQDPPHRRLLLTAPRRRRLPLRQRLRDMRQLRPRPRVRPRPTSPTRRRPRTETRRRTPRLEHRSRPPPTASSKPSTTTSTASTTSDPPTSPLDPPPLAG